ncbi:MAG: response regulator [Candidatus Acidiferrales bacterium]
MPWQLSTRTARPFLRSPTSSAPRAWSPVIRLRREASDGRDAVEKAIELRPDVVLVDISMPELNGLEVARCIHERLPQSEILIVTEHDLRFLAHVPPQPGVRGYVVKSRFGRDLVSAVDAASKHRPLSTSVSA